MVYPYETITYRYDALENRYVRYINGSKTPQVDVADGQVVAPKNVVILRMLFGALNDGHPNKHRLEARNIGKGEAWIATNGVTVKGTWRKASATAPTLLFGPDGEQITLTAGQTFVQVLPLTYTYKITPGTCRRARGRVAGAQAARQRRAPTSAYTRRVSRATSAHVRGAASLRARAASTSRPRTRSSAHAVRSASARRAASRGSTRMPACPTASGSAPTAVATTGTPAATASSAGRPAASRDRGHHDGPRRAHEAGEPFRRHRRRVDQRVAGAARPPARASAARSPGEAPTMSTRGGHGTAAGSPRGRGRSPSSASACRSVATSWRASNRPKYTR